MDGPASSLGWLLATRVPGVVRMSPRTLSRLTVDAQGLGFAEGAAARGGPGFQQVRGKGVLLSSYSVYRLYRSPGVRFVLAPGDLAGGFAL